jgi:hypothetical protein
MTTPEPTGPVPSAGAPPGTRERISCPGCGRHDWVTWPVDNDTYAWKCFNCEKQFTLRRGGKH